MGNFKGFRINILGLCCIISSFRATNKHFSSPHDNNIWRWHFEKLTKVFFFSFFGSILFFLSVCRLTNAFKSVTFCRGGDMCPFISAGPATFDFTGISRSADKASRIKDMLVQRERGKEEVERGGKEEQRTPQTCLHSDSTGGGQHSLKLATFVVQHIECVSSECEC